MSFAAAIEWVLAQEQGYQADPNDDGNWTGGHAGVGELKGTNFGIAAASYPTLDIRSLTRAAATAIYYQDYWLKIGGPLLAPGVDLLVLEQAVNQGQGTAIHDLQQAAHVTLDGEIGPVTAKAARGALFLERYAALRAMRYARARNFPRYGPEWLERLFRSYREALNQAELVTQ